MSTAEPLDPRHLPRSWNPSVIVGTDGHEHFVADATLKPNGWVSVIRWDNSRYKIAPHAVYKIERADIESTTRNQTAGIGLTDDDALEEARRLAQPTETDADADQEVVADD